MAYIQNDYIILYVGHKDVSVELTTETSCDVIYIPYILHELGQVLCRLTVRVTITITRHI